MLSVRNLLGALPFACVVAAWGAFSPLAAHATSITVTTGTPNGWAFDNRDVNGIQNANLTASGGYVNGPASPPLGTGSAHLATGNGTIGGDGTEELRNTNYAGVALSTITALSYSTYSTANNGQQWPYLGLMISTTGSGAPDDIMFFEPTYQQPSTGNSSLPNQGAPVLAQWQTWNAFVGGWWGNNSPGAGDPGGPDPSPGAGAGGVGSIADFLALYPNATIENSDGATGLGGVRFNVGFASDTDQFNGNVDNFTIGVEGQNTTFNFEAAAATPLPAALPMFASGLGALGFLGWRNKKRKTAALAA